MARWIGATNDAFIPRINPIALAITAGGTSTATALYPFGTRTDPAVVDAITNFATDVSIRKRTSLGAVKIDGPIADLPGGQLKVAAGAEYRRETFAQRGVVEATLAGNHVLKFDTQLLPSAQVVNSLHLGVPRSTLRATSGLQSGPVSVASFVNYRAGVTNTFNTPTGVSEFEAGPYMTVDLRITWTLPDAALTTGTELALQVNDLFDEEPPYFPATDGIGGAYNPIGCFIGLNLRNMF